MDDERFTIVIIGLGLMGGSLAFALKGFRNCRLIGYDHSRTTMEAALAQGAVAHTADSMEQAVQNADLVIFCTYPGTIVQDIIRCTGYTKENAVITDICGVKEPLLAGLPRDYIGLHPMAGKEVDGLANAEAGLFHNAGFIIVPQDESRQESLDMLHELAEYVGAGQICVNSARDHDRIIAYTSDLMHITAAALCRDYPRDMTQAHTAGAFRDCTRIANLNAGMWTELLLLNKENIIPVLEKLINSLSDFNQALKNEEPDFIRDFLQTACNNKKAMNNA